MNRIPLVRKNNQNILAISDYEILKHLHKVLKISNGDILKIVLVEEGLANAKVIAISKQEVTIEIFETFPAKQTKSKLIIGLSRPLTCQKILEHGTTLGVSEFHFFKAELSEKSFLESKFIQQQKFESYLLKGLAQSGVYSQLPKVFIHDNFAKISLENFAKDNKYFLSLKSHHFLNQDQHHQKFSTTFLIGPERGFTPEEEMVFEQLDFMPISIGPSIQRVEYAVASSLAQLELLTSQYHPLTSA